MTKMKKAKEENKERQMCLTLADVQKLEEVTAYEESIRSMLQNNISEDFDYGIK